ncbi:hypothetical protein AVEN_110942-1 [Araneus ventricosus]|uniref:Endonuclease/exonuclease/phosphatase domain-containing protein n=1 Tax=Araneus ventricosus TaxID=182803 RepID=A0A4Y2HD82_ARAVE|nr:hypothetical protein AVEN_110942-1 [Araneus ventricosus]
MALKILSWGRPGLQTHKEDIKSIINEYQPICLGLQETYLEPHLSAKFKNYTTQRNDFQQGSLASGGVACLTSCQMPSKSILLNTQLQAVAIQIQLNSRITVCYLYLPPRVHIEQRHLDYLIQQLPSPFFLLGDFNGHNPLWGRTDTNPRGRQIETLIEDRGLCILNDNSYTHFHQASHTFHTIDLAICSPSLAPY